MTTPRITVWFDETCPLCRREMALMRKLDHRGAIEFVSVAEATCPIDPSDLMARFHAQEAGQPIVSGAGAFAALWRALPLLAWLGWMAKVPPILWLLERLYRLFLKFRPRLQGLARKFD
jgi:predicted DCC family thiol-disulfide oxidoreductase YuxK